ncbi:MAG: response regulator [Myxococcota bacterium]
MVSRQLLGELLLDAGWVTSTQLEQGLAQAHHTHERLGRALVSRGVLSEARLTDALGRQSGLPVAPESRLRQVSVPPGVLSMLKGHEARQYHMLPIFFSAHDKTLAVVLTDPLLKDPVEKLKQEHQLERIRVLLGPQDVVRELIDRYYPAQVSEAALGLPGIPMTPVSGNTRPHAGGVGQTTGERPALRTPAHGTPAHGTPIMGTPIMPPPIMPPPVSGSHAVPLRTPAQGTPIMPPPVMGTPIMPPPVSGIHAVPLRTPAQGTPMTGQPVMGTPVMGTPVMGQPVMGTPVMGTPVKTIPVAPVASDGAGSLPSASARASTSTPSREELEPHEQGLLRFTDFYLRTLDMFYSLLEQDREAPSQRQLRQVSQLARLVGQRLGLSARQLEALSVAAYLYPLGDYLLHRGMAGQAVTADNPIKLVAELVAGFGPPLPVVPILQALADDAPVEEEISPAAVLKTVAAYVESRDGSKRYVRAGDEKALKYLRDHRGVRFHARVVDTLFGFTNQEQLLGRLEAGTPGAKTVLLVDKDKLSLEMLEQRFTREGFEVRSARSGDEALKLLEMQLPDLVITEVVLPRLDGFELCARLKSADRTRDIPFFFLSSRSDAGTVTKGLELGAEDFLNKPINLDILLSKVRRLERAMEERRRRQPSGIEGDLRELSLLDLLQVLQLGQKTVKVSLEQGSQRCELCLEQGELKSAILGPLSGREAFFALCLWEEGHFSVVPLQQVPVRNISEHNDFLLMEGMRRADEHKAGIAQDGKGSPRP